MLRRVASIAAIFLSLILGIAQTAFAAPEPFPKTLPWYNVSRPLTWDELAGRAVLLDFFTPGCINCIHMVPVEARLARRFGKRLVIIGVDAPKFTDSGTVSGLKDFIATYAIRHPVVLDKHLQIWNAWNAVAWPTFVLVGPNGDPLGRFIGEQTVADLARPIAAALAGAPPAASLRPLPLMPAPTTRGALDAPAGIAVAGALVAIGDSGHNRIVLTNREGDVLAVVGDGCAGARDGGYAQAEFSRPQGLAFHAGRLYVADTNGQRIRVIDLEARTVTTIAGSGARAYVAAGSFPAMRATLNSPWDVQWLDGKLYVAMAGDHDIWRYDPETKRIGPWAGNGAEGLRDGGLGFAEFAQPSGLAAHGQTLYDADPESSAIRAITPPDGEVRTLVGQGLFRFGLKDGAAREALLQHPQGLTWLNGSLYIADTFNDALRRLDLKTDEVSTVATGLAHPGALAVLSPKALLVAETGAERIASVDPVTGKVSPWPLSGLRPTTCPTAVAPREVSERGRSAR